MDRWKAEDGKSQRREAKKKEDHKRESLRRKKIQVRENVGKSQNPFFFQWFVAPEGRSQLARWDEKLHAVVARSTFASEKAKNTSRSEHFLKLRCRKSARRWREAHFEVKMYKTHQVRTTFGRWDDEKMHGVVARSAFRSQHVQNTPCSDHFLEVELSKKCTPLWREAHFEVKMYKAHQVGTTFGSWDVEKVHAVLVRFTFRSQNVKNTRGSDHFWRFRCRFAWQAPHLVKSEQNVRDFVAFSTTTPTTSHYTPIHYTTLYTQVHSVTLNCTTLHYTTLRYTTLHSTTLHYTLRYTTLHYTALHYITLHYATFHYTTLHYTTLHYTTPHYITLHYATLQLHYIPLRYTHYTPLHYTTLNDTALNQQPQLQLHYITLHYTTPHYITLTTTTTTEDYTTLH